MNNINWLSMLIGTLLPITIGYFYYHKSLFGKVWIDSLNLTEEQAQNGKSLSAGFLALLLSFFMSFFFLNFNNDGINQEGDFDNFQHGAWHGFFVVVTLVIPIIVVNGWLGQKSWKSMLINIGYWLITMLLMGGVLDAMNHWENIVLPEG